MQKKVFQAALRAIAPSLVLVLGGAAAKAEVKLAGVLSDHMVLQQGIDVPVWGTADKGEEVTVAFAGQTEKAKAGDDGRWAVKLHPLTASDKPAELTVTGGGSASSHALTVKDVLVGEVWVCSGQSNMEFRVNGAKNHDQEIAAADFPNVRLFSVKKKISEKPVSDLSPEGGENKWEACDPKTVGNFSAVGYFFGRDLHKDLKIPVGLIHTSWGGTPAEAWTKRDYLEQDPDLSEMAKHADQVSADWQAHKEEYGKALEAWKAAEEEAKKDHKPAPKKPNGPHDPTTDPNLGSVLYNGMIQPIVPYAVKGAIWYQGESNAGRAYQYRKLLPAMIKSWRDVWGEPEMNFLIVSLANFQQPPKQPGDSDWAELREAQTLTAALPHNGQAMAIDLADPGNPGDIHPKDKQDVGHRLELVALNKTYGKADVEFSGPQFESMRIDGDKAVLKFTHADGMHTKAEEGGNKAGEEPRGFQIAGEDQKWAWADAKIEGDTVVATSKEVPHPFAVRYAWATNPIANLYNKSDLPAVPFRTDNWKGVTADRK